MLARVSNGAALDPNDARLPSFFLDASRCQAALYAFVRADGNELVLPLTGGAHVRLAGVRSAHIAFGTWLTAASLAIAARDWPSLGILLAFPDDELARGGASAYARYLVAAFRAYYVGESNVGALLLESLRATDPASLPSSSVDDVLAIHVPALDVFRSLIEHDEARLSSTLKKGAEAHRDFWKPPGPPDNNEDEGYVALLLTALACMARDSGMALPDVDYVPRVVVGEARPTGLLTACPYCVLPLADGAVRCPSCLDDTRNDAPLDLPFEDVFRGRRAACTRCAMPMHALAVRCPRCRLRT